MKRLWSCLLSAVVAFSLVVACAPAAALADIRGTDYVGSTTVTDRRLTVTEAPTIDAAYGVLVDADGNVLWSREADHQSAMASITKIMTAVVALENAQLDDVFTVSAAAASVGESSAGLAQGDKATVYQLLCGLLIHSGNDAGVVLAEGVAGSVESFGDKGSIASWAKEGVGALAANGIMKGSGGKVMPKDSCTVEQCILMCYRVYLSYQ